MICPKCGSEYIKKDGSTYRKQQKYQCNSCKYQFTENSQNRIMSDKPKGKLIIQCDEMWSFVGNKDKKYWIWLALDMSTREIVSAHIGDRSQDGAQTLWDSLPPVYRQCAVCYTDFWEAYACVFPKKRHKAVGKKLGKTRYIERFNNTFR